MLDREIIIVSACLIGENCRYDGQTIMNKQIKKLAERKNVIPVCPESLGGLPTPRPSAEIEIGDGQMVLAGKSRVMNELGEDVTNVFLKGAYEVLKIAHTTGAGKAILKSKSPSCGVYHIKRGDKVIKGTGVASALLANAGILLEEAD